MVSKLNTSGVLSSGVDYFCLVCESRLHHEPGALAHIQKPVHTKKFEETDYFENKENYVRKINKWYFCELCSLLLPTAARARLHVVEPQHLGNKSTKILQRRGTTVVAFSRVQIDDKAWHGIVDDACVICNTEFYDQSIHINETNHIIKLIQSAIEFDSDKNIFRKVDDGSVQCITCNVIIGLNSIDVHFNETEHKTLYEGCCCDDEKIIKKSDLEKIEAYKSNKDNDKDKSSDGNDLKNIVNSNEVNNRKNITLQFSEIDDKKISKNIDTKDYIIANLDGKLLCLLCHWVLDCDINSHINDFHHQTMLELHEDSLKKLNNNKNFAAAQVVKSEDDIVATEEVIVKRPNILDFVDKFKNNDININFELQSAICKKCTKQLHFDVQAIEDHIAKHLTNNDRGNIEKPDENAKSSETQGEKDDDCNKTSLCSKPVLKMDLNVQDMKQDILNPKDDKVSCDAEEDIDNYIKQNNMRSYNNQNKVYCIICNSNIPYSLKSLKEHVAGGGHQRKMEDKKEKEETLIKTKSKRSVGANLNKIKTATYINFFFIAKGFNADVVMNDKICINMFSFLLMVNVGDKFKCLLCNEKIQKFQWKQHMALKMHEDVLDECLVVISKKHDNEFIREFQPGHFHCGYCNIQCDSWETLESHLQSPVHSDNKTSSKWRLEQAEAQIFFLKMQNRLTLAQEGFKLRMVMRDMFRYNDYRSDSDRDNESDSD